MVQYTMLDYIILDSSLGMIMIYIMKGCKILSQLPNCMIGLRQFMKLPYDTETNTLKQNKEIKKPVQQLHISTVRRTRS